MIRTRLLCDLTIAALIPVTLYYIYAGVGWPLKEALIDPKRLLNNGWAHSEAVIATLTAWVFFAMWILLGLFDYIMALRLAMRVRNGCEKSALVICGFGRVIREATKRARKNEAFV